jgi:hypothetical protein
MDESPVKAKATGMGCFTLFLLIAVLIVAVLFGVVEGLSFYSSHCAGESLADCILNKTDTMELTPTEKASMVTAKGTYSYKSYSVEVTAHIPLSGGPIVGVVTGTCDGKMTGTFAGEDDGHINGAMTGACSPFIVPIPASATYEGFIDEKAKIVHMYFTGKGGGLTRQDSMTLSY